MASPFLCHAKGIQFLDPIPLHPPPDLLLYLKYFPLLCVFAENKSMYNWNTSPDLKAAFSTMGVLQKMKNIERGKNSSYGITALEIVEQEKCFPWNVDVGTA